MLLQNLDNTPKNRFNNIQFQSKFIIIPNLAIILLEYPLLLRSNIIILMTTYVLKTTLSHNLVYQECAQAIVDIYRQSLNFELNFQLRSSAQHMHLCSVCPFVRLSVCPAVCLSVSLSISKLNFSQFGPCLTAYDSLCQLLRAFDGICQL